MRLLLPLLFCACVEPEAPAPIVEPDEPTADTQDTAPEPPGPWRSSLYPADWTPAFSVDGLFLHDFSWAGYHSGEAPLPASPAPIITPEGLDATGASDVTAALQDALDGLVDGGTLLLPPGTFRIEGTLTIGTSGVVLAGDPEGLTQLHFTGATGFGGAGLRFDGRASASEGQWLLASDGSITSHTLTLSNTESLEVGQDIAIGWVITDEFTADHGMTDVWTISSGQWRPFFRRTITAIEGDTITVDVPLRYPALTRDGASVRPDDLYLTEVGLRDLVLSSASEQPKADSQHHAVHLRRVKDAFVDNVRSYAPEGFDHHLRSGGLLVEKSRNVTISNTHFGEAANRGTGGNGYLFEIRQSGEVLIADSSASGGRHNFIQNWDFGTSGCVFLRTTSSDGVAENGPFRIVGASEFHHSLAMANLIDASEVHDAWQAKNRHDQSSGAGHTATGTVFWNTTGTGTLTSQQFGFGYVIGTSPEVEVITDPEAFDLLLGGQGTAPEDFSEGVGLAELLEPQSLYEDQLAKRLGR